MAASGSAAEAWPLEGVRVLEVADETGEFCGRCIAGGGADVIKVEPPGGSPTRAIGPFYEDVAGPDRSLYFWQYNLGKRSIELDLDSEEGRRAFAALARSADVVIEAGSRGLLEAHGLSAERLAVENPRLVHCAITPFGQTGPQRDDLAYDLVHLALGGQVMMCGYDPVGAYDPKDPRAHYDTPPVAPQMWHSAHMAGLQASFAIEAALFHQLRTGAGQYIDFSVHEACSGTTEVGVPFWIYEQLPTYRLTGRHAWAEVSQESQFVTGDGAWAVAQPAIGANWQRLVGLLEANDAVDDLADPRYADVRYRSSSEVAGHVTEVMLGFTLMRSAEEVMEAGQQAGLPWGAVRRPEENVADPHWQERGMFAEIEHPEHGRSFTHVAAPWVSDDMPWRVGERAPLVGEHTAAVLAELDRDAKAPS